MLVADHIEQRDRQHHADDQVGECRDHERAHRTGAAQHAVAHELGANDQIERHDREQIASCDIDNAGGAARRDEQADDLIRERQIDRHEHHRQAERIHRAPFEARTDAVELARADILCNIAGQTRGERHTAGQRKLVDAVCRREARDDRRAAQVDVILNEYIAHRHKALLGDGRHGVVGQAAQHFGREQHEVVARIKRTHAAQQQHECQHTGCALRDKGRPRNTGDTPLEPGDEHKVQDNVAHRGQHQQDERRAAVTHGVEDTRTHVVDEQEQQAEYIYAQIQRAVREDVLRRRERIHDAVRADSADERQQQRDCRGGEQRGRDRRFHTQIALRAEQLGYEHARTDIDTGRDRNEQLRDGVARADSGQRQLACLRSGGKTAYDDGVGHLVQLLECHAQQQRDGKPEQLL